MKPTQTFDEWWEENSGLLPYTRKSEACYIWQNAILQAVKICISQKENQIIPDLKDLL